MTFASHALFTALGVQLLSLHGQDIALAYIFGVAIDLDHIIKAPLYFKKYGFKSTTHYNWRTPLQEPISLLWIIPLSIYLSTYIPVIFFLGHLFLDYLVSYVKKPFFPFNKYKTHGFLSNIDDAKKDKLAETITAIILICSNLILILIKK